MNPHTGGDFDDFLEEDGILEEVSAKARKRLLSMQLADSLGNFVFDRVVLYKLNV